MKTIAIVLAGGSGKRMNSAVKKQFIEIDGKPLLYYALKTFEDSFIDEVVLVASNEDTEYCQKEIIEKFNLTKVKKIVPGGKERYHSVANGIAAINGIVPINDSAAIDGTATINGVSAINDSVTINDSATLNSIATENDILVTKNKDATNGTKAECVCDYVFIHDGARPFVTLDMLERLLEEVKVNKACVAGMPVKDTIKIAGEDGFIETTPRRELVWTIQTPQVFEYELIDKAYTCLLKEEKSLIEKGISITDDAMVVETFLGEKVKLVEGSYENIKVTTPEDISVSEAFLQLKKINLKK